MAAALFYTQTISFALFLRILLAKALCNPRQSDDESVKASRQWRKGKQSCLANLKATPATVIAIYKAVGSWNYITANVRIGVTQNCFQHTRQRKLLEEKLRNDGKQTEMRAASDSKSFLPYSLFFFLSNLRRSFLLILADWFISMLWKEVELGFTTIWTSGRMSKGTCSWIFM